MSQIYEIFGRDAHAMTIRLMTEAAVASRIPKGASIALKPNLVVAAKPETGATTHPGVLSGAIEYLQAHGFDRICVMEGSWIGDRTDRTRRVAGYDRICAAYRVPFYDLKQDSTITVQSAVGPMDICRLALEADYLIDLPVLKGHCQTLMTCALKNLKGCLPDREKRHFHTLGLHKPIGALAAALRPRLVIVDSICGDLDFEEGGNPVHTNRMLLGFDPVRIDAYGCSLMGIPVDDVPYIRYAEQWGAGSAAFSPEDIVTLNRPQEAADYPAPTGVVANLTRSVHQDRACSACFASLVRALHLSGGCSSPVYIGQGFRGKAVDGLGIGVCCSCASSCVRGCPPSAQDILKALQERP
ncbi:MAG: DUF362 domain-containing protein [Clostridia bacterium]|nr:DUF362 domain-containing protein [Clostridia bacterium]